MPETSAPDAKPLTRGDDWHFSASQIELLLSCLRKWGWKYPGNQRTDAGPGAALGTRVHKVLEDYLDHGGELPFSSPDPLVREAAYILAPGLEHFPKPGTPTLKAEREFRFEIDIPGTDLPLRFTGKIDASTCQPGQTVEVFDLKTSKDIPQYHKSAEVLAEDPQALLYAFWAMLEWGVDEVKCTWVYVATKGKKYAKAVSILLTSAHVMPRIEALFPLLIHARIVLQRSLLPVVLPPDTSHCNAFGGCPYIGQCEKVDGKTNPFTRMKSR